MKTKQLFVTLVLLICSSLLFAKDDLSLAAMLIPENLTENADEVIRSERRDFFVKSTKEGQLIHRKVVTIFSKDSDANVLRVPYDKDTKVKNIKAKLYNAMGFLVRKIESSEIKDYAAVDGVSFASDSRFKYLEISYDSYPYTIEYEYEQNLKGAYFHAYPDWYIQFYDQAVQESIFSISIDANLKFYHKAYNVDIEPVVTEALGRKKYIWRVKDLPAIEYEPYGPYFTSICPFILFSPDEFYFAGYRGSMASWKDYGQFMNQLYEGRDEIPKELATEINALTANLSSDREKIEVLYRYMQENTRYVGVQLGIGGWQPFDATYVNKNKYGDCKALTNFMKAMLKHVGITAYPVLIRNGKLTYEVTEAYTTPKFNHVILNVPSEDYWLECTSQSYPPNYIGSSNMDRNVLLVDESGGQLIRTPTLSAEDNLEQRKVLITLAPNGAADLTNSVIGTGEAHEWYRYMAKNYSQEERKESLKENSSLPSFEIKNLNVSASSTLPEASVDYAVFIPRYAAKAGKRLFVPVNSINPVSSVPPEVKERKFPIVIRSSYTELDTISIQIPEGYEIESIPTTEFTKQTDYLDYSMKIEKKPNSITYYRKLQVRAAELPATAYGDYRTLIKEISKKDKMKIVLVQKRT